MRRFCPQNRNYSGRSIEVSRNNGAVNKPAGTSFVLSPGPNKEKGADISKSQVSVSMPCIALIGLTRRFDISEGTVEEMTRELERNCIP